jgi:hypothetical protein
VVDAELVEDDAESFLSGDDEPSGTELAGQMQLRRIEVLFGEIGVGEKDRLAAGSIALGRKLLKYTGITADEAGVMLDILSTSAKASEPKATLRRLVTARRDERIAAEAADDEGPADEKTPF